VPAALLLHSPPPFAGFGINVAAEQRGSRQCSPAYGVSLANIRTSSKCPELVRTFASPCKLKESLPRPWPYTWDMTKHLEHLALRIHGAFEAIPSRLWSKRGGPFPRGWCSDASQVCGAILSDHGHTDFVCVNGARGEDRSQSHSWLSGYGLIIDLTAGQFDDAPEGVVIFRNTSWHQQFKDQEETLADFRELTHSGFGDMNNLPDIYQYISSKIIST